MVAFRTGRLSIPDALTIEAHIACHRNLNKELTGTLENILERCLLDLSYFQTRNTIKRKKGKKQYLKLEWS